MERLAARSNKKARGSPKGGTKTNALKRPAGDILRDSSSEDEEGIVRPRKDKVMSVSKADFMEKMKLVNHPILQDEDQLEMTFRYIDLANSMMKNPGKKMEEMTERLEDQDRVDRRTSQGRDEPAFFRGDMATTVMVNGVDQIVRYRRDRGWSQALSGLFWEARVTVRDYWVVKKQGDTVVSVLVQTLSRYHKIRAVEAVNDVRDKISENLGRVQCRVNVRDAFPKGQMVQVQKAYNLGFQMKKEGKIQAYRIYNQGGQEPVFEVRTIKDGKSGWGPAPVHMERTAEDMDTSRAEKDYMHQEAGTAAAGGDEATSTGTAATAMGEGAGGGQAGN
jgi:hypothetical protein